MSLYFWSDLNDDVKTLADQVTANAFKPDVVLGLSRGGIVPGFLLSGLLGCDYKTVNPFAPLSRELVGMNTLLVDDVEDSGTSLAYFKDYPKLRTAVLHTVHKNTDYFASEKPEGWITYPWETANDESGGMKQAVVALLRGVGENPLREGLLETPKRVEKAYLELTEGYKIDIPSLFKVFDGEGCDDIVTLKDIPFYSLCEHHALPFFGTASIAYIPKKKIIGVSKLARLVHAFSRRLQVQERLTRQIATTLEQYLDPKGVAVVLKGEHMCMRMRGIESKGTMETTCVLGAFRKDAKARQEIVASFNSK